ncbi:MAG: restriction endonuclease subunit S domain-containing protein [Marinobacter adhaerens]
MTFPRYPEYKDSGVNWLEQVPVHWEVFSLKRSVVGCTNGIWGNEPDGENDVAVIRVADFERNNLRVGLEKLTYRSVTPNEYSSRALKKGDLLIEKSGGGEKTLVGCVVLYTHEFKSVTSNFVARMRPLGEFDSNFLCYCFDSLYQGRVNYPAIKQTTGIQNLDSEAYLQERFCFPALAEQVQIARFLNHETAKIDALIQEQERLIELLQEKRQAVISHSVTKGLDPGVPMKNSGVDWLGRVPTHWDVIALKYLVSEKVAGPYGASLTKSMYSSEGYRVFGQQQVISDDFTLGDYYIPEEKYEEMQRYTVYPGDILITVMGTVGKVSVVPDNVEPGIINPRLVRYRFNPRLVAPGYVKALLLSLPFQGRLKEAAQGSTMDGLNMGILGDLPILVPTIEVQEEIARAVEVHKSRFDSALASSQELIQLLKERRSALISAAVTGKIDVRNWQPPADESAFDEEIRQAGLETTA